MGLFFNFIFAMLLNFGFYKLISRWMQLNPVIYAFTAVLSWVLVNALDGTLHL